MLFEKPIRPFSIELRTFFSNFRKYTIWVYLKNIWTLPLAFCSEIHPVWWDDIENSIQPFFSVGLRHFMIFSKTVGGILKMYPGFFRVLLLYIVKEYLHKILDPPPVRSSVSQSASSSVRPSKFAILFWTVPAFRAYLYMLYICTVFYASIEEKNHILLIK